MSEALGDLTNELVDMMDAAEELGYRGVLHKLEEAQGPLSSAELAAQQYENGREVHY